MAITLTTAASRITTNAAAVATAMAGGTTTAEAQAIGDMILTLSLRNDLSVPLLQLAATGRAQLIPSRGT